MTAANSKSHRPRHAFARWQSQQKPSRRERHSGRFNGHCPRFRPVGDDPALSLYRRRERACSPFP